MTPPPVARGGPVLERRMGVAGWPEGLAPNAMV